ncbi:Oidioi.mRNA.OKI2018_I69.chr1.g3255.t1.cds [Oikopleura dioica]|uniref:Oidioi.mRNA.OKI2018_I69.chr1.g3255.t1.cds n=1 Tax=Oikopleura dioica TaxID=34765 RepID=A0ABN7T0D9_OIKDI|nr:Oidioi.mRNA.OKI2018_I69.chr1.g3255.t1.cds [Oikopleura dioica]
MINYMVNDTDKPGLMKPVEKVSYPSNWVVVDTAAKIFTGLFNFTQIPWDDVYLDPGNDKTQEKAEEVKTIVKRTVEEISQEFLSSGNVHFSQSPKNRTFARVDMFFKLDASAKVNDLNSRIRHVWPTGENRGLDFFSIEISDFDECGTVWDDCNRDAKCTNMEGAFRCECLPGYYDQSRILFLPMGRVCKHTSVDELITKPTEKPLDPNARDAFINEQFSSQHDRNSPAVDFASRLGLANLGPPGLPSGSYDILPNTMKPGKWTDGIDWPGPLGVRTRTTGPTSLFINWQMIDHDTYGNRFFYVLAYHDVGATEVKWNEWLLGSKVDKVEVDGLTQNRQYNIKVGVRKMDIAHGENTTTAWSDPAVGETFIASYNARTILAKTKWDSCYKNKFSGAHLKLVSQLQSNSKLLFSSPAMNYGGKDLRSKFLKSDDFRFESSELKNVVVFWRLYFKPLDKSWEAPALEQLLKDMLSGVIISKYNLRNVPKFEDGNLLARNSKYMRIFDIDECATDQHDCDMNARCINSPGDFKCVCKSNFDDVSAPYPPGRYCKINPDKPVIDYDDYIDTAVDTSMPEGSKAAELLAGQRPKNEHNYNHGVWLRKYSMCTPLNPRMTQPAVYVKSGSSEKCEPVFIYKSSATLALSDVQKRSYKPRDVYDRESFTYKNLTLKMDHQINELLNFELGSEFIKSSVLGLRLSDRREMAIEVDFLVFLQRREANSTAAYKQYNPNQLQRSLWEIFSEYRPGNGDFQFQFDKTDTTVTDLNECLTKMHDCDKQADCINTEGGFECSCKPGFKDSSRKGEGRKCQDQCRPSPCKNSQQCLKTNLVGMPVCKCKSPYRGEFCEIVDPLRKLPSFGTKSPTAALVLIVVVGLIIILAIPLLSMICCFFCPVKTKYSRMLEDRIKKNHQFSERQKFRREEEEKRLDEIYKQRQIKEEFFNAKNSEEEKIDLKNLGFKSVADFDPKHISSRPENLLATSQRMMESTSIMEVKNQEDDEVSETGPVITQVGFKPLVNSTGDIKDEESKTEKNSEGIGSLMADILAIGAKKVNEDEKGLVEEENVQESNAVDETEALETYAETTVNSHGNMKTETHDDSSSTDSVTTDSITSYSGTETITESRQ